MNIVKVGTYEVTAAAGILWRKIKRQDTFLTRFWTLFLILMPIALLLNWLLNPLWR